MQAFWRHVRKGLWEEIPVFRLVLGMCPTLAVSTSLENGIGMGLAATFVLMGSNVFISLLRHAIPNKVRIPCYIVVAATFVTITDLLMNAFAHDIHRNLGIFIPLIVVNCIILGRAEAFAGKNPVGLALADGIGMGLGFTVALAVVSTAREVLGNGTITLWQEWGWAWTVPGYTPAIMLILAPGGFIVLGLLLAGMNHLQAALTRRRGKGFMPPSHLGCRRCTLCTALR